MRNHIPKMLCIFLTGDAYAPYATCMTSYPNALNFCSSKGGIDPSPLPSGSAPDLGDVSYLAGKEQRPCYGGLGDEVRRSSGLSRLNFFAMTPA